MASLIVIGLIYSGYGRVVNKPKYSVNNVYFKTVTVGETRKCDKFDFQNGYYDVLCLEDGDFTYKETAACNDETCAATKCEELPQKMCATGIDLLDVDGKFMSSCASDQKGCVTQSNRYLKLAFPKIHSTHTTRFAVIQPDGLKTYECQDAYDFGDVTNILCEGGDSTFTETSVDCSDNDNCKAKKCEEFTSGCDTDFLLFDEAGEFAALCRLGDDGKCESVFLNPDLPIRPPAARGDAWIIQQPKGAVGKMNCSSSAGIYPAACCNGDDADEACLSVTDCKSMGVNVCESRAVDIFSKKGDYLMTCLKNGNDCYEMYNTSPTTVIPTYNVFFRQRPGYSPAEFKCEDVEYKRFGFGNSQLNLCRNPKNVPTCKVQNDEVLTCEAEKCQYLDTNQCTANGKYTIYTNNLDGTGSPINGTCTRTDNDLTSNKECMAVDDLRGLDGRPYNAKFDQYLMVSHETVEKQLCDDDAKTKKYKPTICISTTTHGAMCTGVGKRRDKCMVRSCSLFEQAQCNSDIIDGSTWAIVGHCLWKDGACVRDTNGPLPSPTPPRSSTHRQIVRGVVLLLLTSLIL